MILLAIGRVVLYFNPGLLPDRDKRRIFADYADSLLTAGVAAVLLITFVVRSFYIPSGSMIPTLKIHDFILVNELVYDFAKPARDEIIVFHPPKPENTRQDWIKRIVGIAGDVLQVRNGYLIRNGKKIYEPFINDPGHIMDPGMLAKPYRVPPGCVFVMGDNRNDSLDSRIWGPLRTNRIVGRASLIFFPPSHVGLLR